jgi:hypothetical protein
LCCAGISERERAQRKESNSASTTIHFTAWLIEVRWISRETLPQVVGLVLLVLPGLPGFFKYQVGRLLLEPAMDCVSGVQSCHSHLPSSVLHSGIEEGKAHFPEAVVLAQGKSGHFNGNARWAGR